MGIGIKDLFWLGDKIVWRNFLKHYILCVLVTANYCFIAADQFDPNVLKNIVFWVPQELPEAPIREIYQRISAEFLEESAVKTFLSLMAARTPPVRRGELTSYLCALHGFALQIVLQEYRERGLLPPPSATAASPPREKLRRDAIAMMEGVMKIKSSEYPPERISEALFAANEAAVAQMMLINEYNLPDRDKQMPIVFLTSRFPVAYVAALDKLVHRDWYVACFTKTAENHSMWSTYPNGHRGVCSRSGGRFFSEPMPRPSQLGKTNGNRESHRNGGSFSTRRLPMTKRNAFALEHFNYGRRNGSN